MFIEMSCRCDSSFQVDTEENETLMMVWAHAFVNAHNECGYMTKPITQNSEEKTQRYDVIYKEEREKEL